MTDVVRNSYKFIMTGGESTWTVSYTHLVEEKADSITGYVVKESGLVPFTVTLGELTDDEREIILKGCLINYNRK